MNWKTTTAGVLTILGAIGGGFLSWLKTNTLPDFGAIAAAITVGVGLIFAKDATNPK